MGQIFVYKLYTFFDGYRALVLPLQHFTFTQVSDLASAG